MFDWGSNVIWEYIFRYIWWNRSSRRCDRSSCCRFFVNIWWYIKKIFVEKGIVGIVGVEVVFIFFLLLLVNFWDIDFLDCIWLLLLVVEILFGIKDGLDLGVVDL